MARSGWQKSCRGTGERREEGGGREAGTGKREGGGRREGRKRDLPVVLGVQRGSLGALERCLGGLGWSSGVPGVLLGDPRGLFGSSWALPRGSWDVFWGSVVPVEPKRTILGTSSWGSWQAGLLSKGQRATKQETGEHACQETKTDDSGDLLLGLLASMFTVEKRSAPGGPQREVIRVRGGQCLSVGAQTRTLYTDKLALRPEDRGLSAIILDFGSKQMVQRQLSAPVGHKGRRICIKPCKAG